MLCLTACSSEADGSAGAAGSTSPAAPSTGAPADASADATAGAPSAEPSGAEESPGAASPGDGPSGAAPGPAPATEPPGPPPSPQGPQDPLAGPGETAPAPGLPTCDPAALTVTDADAVFGPTTVQQLFTVRTAGSDCQLPGEHPEVSVLGPSGVVLGQVTTGGPGLPAPAGTPLTLSSGTSLSFYLQTGRDGLCTQAGSVRVVLAGTTAAVTAPTSLSVCDGAASVGPLQRLGTGE